MYDTVFLSKVTQVDPVGILQFFNVSATISDASHLWFIFSIIGLYMLTPLIRGSFYLSNRKNIFKNNTGNGFHIKSNISQCN